MTVDSPTPSTAPRQLGRVLVVDDEVFIQNAFRLYLETVGYDVSVADGGDQALKQFDAPDADIDVVLLDLVMPGWNGLDLLKIFKKSRPDVMVIIATGCGSISSAIEAMQNGAFDYVTKPIVNFEEELLTVIEAAILQRRDLRRNTQPSEGGNSGDARIDRKALQLFEGLITLAEDLARSPPGMKPEAAFHDLTSLLQERLSICAGMFFLSDQNGQFADCRAWGAIEAVEFTGGWISSHSIQNAAIEGRFLSFTVDGLHLGRLGGELGPTTFHPVALHVPVFLDGCHRGALFLFFDPKADAFVEAGPVHDGRAYLLLAPLLGSRLHGLVAELATR